ncbi:MAG: WecB/TagA/CpsF family glycosyltransferase, partial [Pseudonocardiaceae bacterium]
TLFSLHVGGLNLRNRPDFTTALNRADFVVPDGISVAALARIAGASGLHRHPTTDIGWELLTGIAARLQRPVKVALIGGPEGLAMRAGVVMAEHPNIDVVFADHGYWTDWMPALQRLDSAGWDVLVVGMGMPTEALWVDEHRSHLHGSLVLTCGGWFGHIVGDERRAPAWMRRAGLEWAARLAQQPARLAGRYTKGLFSTIAMIPVALRSRRKQAATSHGGAGGSGA